MTILEKIKTGWNLTKKSFSVINNNRLLLLPFFVPALFTIATQALGVSYNFPWQLLLVFLYIEVLITLFLELCVTHKMLAANGVFTSQLSLCKKNALPIIFWTALTLIFHAAVRLHQLALPLLLVLPLFVQVVASEELNISQALIKSWTMLKKIYVEMISARIFLTGCFIVVLIMLIVPLFALTLLIPWMNPTLGGFILFGFKILSNLIATSSIAGWLTITIILNTNLYHYYHKGQELELEELRTPQF